MSITYKDIFSVAEHLNDLGTEAGWRSCISRAYYSSYHSCKILADRFPEAPEGSYKGSHEKLSQTFTSYRNSKNQPAVLAARSVGVLLLSFKSMRHKSDYKMTMDVKASDAMQAIGFYTKLEEKIQEIDKLLR